MAKTIVTHIRPDLDACCSVWLVKTYFPNFKNADLEFVNSGDTINHEPADTNPNIIHVDVGMGKFDHHQLTEHTSASERIFIFLVKEKLIKSQDTKALKRLVRLVTLIDNFDDCLWPDASSDIYELNISQILEAYKYIHNDDYLVIDFASQLFEALFKIFKQKIKAEQDLEKAKTFNIKQNKCLMLETKRDSAARLAQLKGYALVVYRNPETGVVKIKARPDAPFILKKVYEAIIKEDSPQNWYYHEPSGKLVLNGSNKGPKKPTKLSLQKVVDIVVKVLNPIV